MPNVAIEIRKYGPTPLQNPNPGVPFDIQPMVARMVIAGLHIWVTPLPQLGDRTIISALQAIYRDLDTGEIVYSQIAGNTTGEDHEVMLDVEEHISQVRGRTGWYVDLLTLETTRGRIVGPFAGPGGENSYEFPQEVVLNEILSGFFGRADGQGIQSLGVYTVQKPF